MEQKFDFRKYLPHAGIILLFYLISSIYFKDIVFSGKSLRQNDVIHYKGMSREIMEYREKGENILWTGIAFGGMPTFQIHAEYPNNLVGYLDKLTTKLLPHPVYNVFLAMVCFFILMMVLRINIWVAIAGSVSFGFASNSFILLEAGHNSQVHAIAYMPGVLAGVLLTYRGKILGGATLTALFLALEIKANHLQMAYYLFLLIGLVGLAYLIDAIRKKEIVSFAKASGALMFAAILGVGVNAGLLWATYDYSKYTTRGKSDLTIEPDGKKKLTESSGLDIDYALSWSYGKGEAMNIMIPNFKGGSSTPMKDEHKDLVKKIVHDPQLAEAAGSMSSYFGDMPFTSGPVYIGAVIIFLFLLGVFLTTGPVKWAMLAGVVLSIMLSWGKNFEGLSQFFFENFPGYNKFRSVCFILIIAQLAVPVLATVMLDKIVSSTGFFNEKFRKFNFPNLRMLYVAFGLTGGISFLVWLTPTTFTDLTGPGELDQLKAEFKRGNPELEDKKIDNYIDNVWPSVEELREAIVMKDAMRSFIFILLAAGAIFMFAKGKLKPMYLGIILSFLVLADMWGVNMRYVSSEDMVRKKEIDNPFAVAPYYRPHEADKMIMADEEHFRVFNQLARLDQDAASCFFHNSLSGYHGAKLERFQEMVDFHLYSGNMAVYNMLNTKYFITRGMEEGGPPMAMPNPEALGNAWFVDEYKLVVSPDSEIMALKKFDPSKTVIIDQKYKPSLPGSITADSMATATLTNYHPDKLSYEVDSKTGGIVVFSEIFYPGGWNAYIDGTLKEHYCANYILRGLTVPAGKHKIEFRFEPSAYYTGETISLMSSIILVLMFGGVGFLAWRNKEKKV